MTTRRLAAILAADVVGFSSMMEKDEEGTLRRVKALQKEVIEPKVRERGGRLVKTTGDGFLCEFSSPVEAVRCAVEVQEATKAVGVSDLLLRMGINLGDIIVEPDGDIYGDGVNVAARLEQLADPGGVCISGSVHEHAEGKVGVRFESRGEQQVKNIDRPVRVYALAGGAQKVSEPKPLPLPDKPSIAVLPFTNMSGDPEQDYFSDGLVEDIITALSRVRWFFVVARNSSFTYKGRAVDVKQVGRELGVRYVLEGSIRRAADRVRIAGQLIEAATGHHLWADRFEGSVRDVFALQDEVTSCVVAAINPAMERAEIERAKHKHTDNLDAYDNFLRGIAIRYGTWTREAREDALQSFNRAIALDPEFAAAYAGAAMCYVALKDSNWMVDPPQEIAKGLQLARNAIQLGTEDPFSLCHGGWALVQLGRDINAGAPLIERALTLNPNMTSARVFSGWLSIWRGEPDTAVRLVTEAIRLSPLDPMMYFWNCTMAHAYFHAERFDEAGSWAEKSVSEAPNYAGVVRILAANYAWMGRISEAQHAVEKLREIDPMLRLSNLRHVLGPYRPEGLARFHEGLRLAGLPE